MTVRDDEGSEHVVSCALFADDVIAYAPSVGDRVGVKFCGPRDRRDGEGTYDKFIVAFEKEPAADVDWAAMAEDRRLAVQAADPRDSTSWTGPEPEPLADPGDRAGAATEGKRA